MGLAPQLITDELYEKARKKLQNLSQDNRAAIRLRAIVSAKKEGMGVVAKVFGVTSNTLRSWIKAFEKEGLLGLDIKPGRGRKGKLTQEHLDLLRAWVAENPNLTIDAILLKLKENCNLESSKSAVHRYLQKLGLSYITPRPVHHKQDKTSHPEFKKKSGEKDGGLSR